MNNLQDNPFINFFLSLFNVPIKSAGRSNVKMTRDGQNYKFNQRPPAEGYTYYDRSDGNTYKFVNGKRILKAQSKKSKQITQQRQQKMLQQVKRNKETDEKIAKTPGYGGTGKNEIGGGYNVYKLHRTINPSARWDPKGLVEQGFNYITNSNFREEVADNGKIKYKPNIESEAYFNRHLGFNRDYSRMPINGIRFTGDYNSNGTFKFPHAEYTGVSKDAKNAIRRLVDDGTIKVPTDGNWRTKKETWRNNDKNLEQLASFAIRENNGSGIYDIFDSYDFNDSGIKFFMPNLNRFPGKQIEVRDTIWGKNAIPELYNIDFSTRK